MKLSRFIKNISTKLCFLGRCNISSSSTIAYASDSVQSLSQTQDEAYTAGEADSLSIAAVGPLSPSPYPYFPQQRSLSQRSAAPSFRTINFANGGLAMAPDELMFERPGPAVLAPITEEKPSEGEEYEADIRRESDAVAALKAELQMLNLVNQRHVDEIAQLSQSLERSGSVNFELQQSKFAHPRKLKRQVKFLAAKLHARETEIHAKDVVIDEWNKRFDCLTSADQWRECHRGTKDLMESCVVEMEEQAQVWRERMEEVGRMRRQVERKGLDLGMFWTHRDLEDVTAPIDRTEGYRFASAG